MDSSFPKKIHIVFPDNDHADIVQLDETTWACPVCGYALSEEPFGPTGAGSYGICDSCHVEFGYDDCAPSQPPSSPDEWKVRKKANLLRSHVDGWKEIRDVWLQRTKITEEIRAQLANVGVSV